MAYFWCLPMYIYVLPKCLKKIKNDSSNEKKIEDKGIAQRRVEISSEPGAVCELISAALGAASQWLVHKGQWCSKNSVSTTAGFWNRNYPFRGEKCVMVAVHYISMKNTQHETHKGRHENRKISENTMVEFTGDMGKFGEKRKRTDQFFSHWKGTHYSLGKNNSSHPPLVISLRL